ncbi:SDR family oxidoreductase [Chloroflexi bacterium]|nr:short-chain dehydrogenase [Chloroflexota bacterium]MDC0253084.1 SDR family oxidoreductase [Chloroflexota bacterium]RZP13412.1 MAG: SDR family oxidoreductase [Chloroflexota bacterium]|tara:strand:+ start:12783 stop:13598 length:816 start_codon:yes stop_codon:yes gene_type:complete
MSKELEGKVAIITGAGRLRGIGRASAVALAEMGANVVVTGTGRDPESYPEDERAIGWKDIESTAEQIREKGSKAKSIVMDISKEEDVDNMIKETINEFGRIDILVNNAAPPYGEDRVPVVEVDNEVFKKVIFVKVYGSYLCSKAAAKIMIDQGQGGRIINLSSSAGKEGNARMAAYNAANFGLEGFSQSLAKELASHQITVNCVCPGQTETSRLDPLGRGALWNSKAEIIPMGRVGTDEEVADLIAFLSSDKARFITGQAININGGSITAR